MSILGNIIWLVFGGLLSALGWCVAGLIWCVTLIGIPWGIQCFKFAKLSLAPFGKTVKPGGGAPSLLANIVWLLFSGLALAISHAVCGLLFCLTIVGIPFGKQHFKLAALALTPFGARVE